MTDPTPTPTPTDPPAPKETDWVAEARKWEQRAKDNGKRAKDNEDAARRLTELENASKSDLERAIARAETAEQRVSEFEARDRIAGWKADIATATGVPAQYLRGSTEEELKADAEQLKPLFDQQREQQSRGPIVPTAGRTPTTTPTDEQAFAREFFGGD